MKTLDRRDFLKKASLAGASALTVPTLFESCTSKASASTVVATDGLESKLIVPKNNGLKMAQSETLGDCVKILIFAS